MTTDTQPLTVASLTEAQWSALRVAVDRPLGTICPVIGARGRRIHNAAEAAVLGALYRRGLADQNGGIPIVTDLGRAIVCGAAS